MLLHAKVLEAKDLPESQNIFATLLIDEEGKLNSTEKIGNNNPTWNQEFDFRFTNQDKAILKVKVFNYDGLIDDKIGKVTIPMSSISDLNQDHDNWYEIKNKQGEVKGSIHLVLNLKESGKTNSDADLDDLLAQIDETGDDNVGAQNSYEAQKYLISFNIISLEGAENLKDMKKADSTPDFYTTLQIKGRKRIERTCVKIGNLQPTWDQTFNFHTEAKYSTIFNIQLKDHQDDEDKDKIVAECEFPLTEIPDDTTDFDSWIDLKSTTNDEKCRLHVKIHLEPTNDVSDDEENDSILDIKFDKNNLFPEYCNFDVTVIEAKDLPSVDFTSGADPYCTVQLGIKKQTKVIKGNLNPVWNDEFHFSIGNRSEINLIITVIDDNKLVKDKEMSKIEIPAASFTELTDKWYDLQPFKNVKKGGKIHLLVKCTDPLAAQNNATTVTTNSVTEKTITSSPVSTTTTTTSTVTTSTTTSNSGTTTSHIEHQEKQETTSSEEGKSESQKREIDVDGPEMHQEEESIGTNPPWMVDVEEFEAQNTNESHDTGNQVESPPQEAEKIECDPPWIMDEEQIKALEEQHPNEGEIDNETQNSTLQSEPLISHPIEPQEVVSSKEPPNSVNTNDQTSQGEEEIGIKPPMMVDQNQPEAENQGGQAATENQEKNTPAGNVEVQPNLGDTKGELPQGEEGEGEEIGTNPPCMVDQDQAATGNQEDHNEPGNVEVQPNSGNTKEELPQGEEGEEEIGTNPPCMVDQDQAATGNQEDHNEPGNVEIVEAPEREGGGEEEISTNPPWTVDGDHLSQDNQENTDNLQKPNDFEIYEEDNLEHYDEEEEIYYESNPSSPRNRPRTKREKFDQTMTAYIKHNMKVEQKQSPTKALEPNYYEEEEEKGKEEEEVVTPEEEQLNEKQLKQQQEEEFEQELEERKHEIKERVVSDALRIYQENVLIPLQKYNQKRPTMKSTDRVLFNNDQNLNALKEKQADPENMSPNKLKKEINNLKVEIKSLDQEIEKLEREIEELQQ